MTLWIDKMSSVFALEKKKLLAIALASLLTCQSEYIIIFLIQWNIFYKLYSFFLFTSIILDKVCGLFMRICETINDILPPTDTGEEIEYEKFMTSFLKSGN